MAKIQISKAEVRQIIKEEYQKAITKRKLETKLHQINEEIQKIVSEDENLEEVTAGGESKVRSTAWTGEENGDTKYKPEFEKKGSHLVEEDEIEISDEISDETSGENSDENPDEMGEIGEETIDTILAKLAGAIKDEIQTTVDDKMDNEVPAEIGGGEETIDIDAPSEEIDEKKVPCGEGCTEEGTIKEQDGTSVAQEIAPKEAVPFDNGKAEIKKEGQLVSESTKKRMQILSGIQRNDFHDK